MKITDVEVIQFRTTTRQRVSKWGRERRNPHCHRSTLSGIDFSSNRSIHSLGIRRRSS